MTEDLLCERAEEMPIEMRCENFSGFRERLTKEGRWEQYATRIVELRKQGLSGIQARGVAMPEFGGIPSNHAKIAAIAPPRNAAPKKVPRKPAADDADAPPADGDVTLAMFEGKDCDERQCVQFVFEHMDVADVQPTMAPSSGAWSLLQMCRKYPSFRAEFYKTIWPKLLPTKSQMDLQNQFADDGRDAQELIAKMKQQLTENPSPA